MRKKWTLFLALCMMAATSVSANTLAGATTTAKEASKDAAKEADKDVAKDADAKEADKDAKKADAKEADKDAKKADAKEADKDTKKADEKEADKDAKKADTKEADKDAKDALPEKAEDLTDAQIVKVVNDAYQNEVTLLNAYDKSSNMDLPDYHALKADYDTKEKVEAFIAGSFSEKYTKAFMTATAGEKYKVFDGKSYVKVGDLADAPDFAKAEVKAKKVKDNNLTVTLSAICAGSTTTYEASLVNEEGTWKVDAITYTDNGQTVSVLI